MRLGERRMSDEHDLGGVKRSPRSDWAISIEEKVRAEAPMPMSYDVDSNQPARFSEYSYTEIANGFYINTQSVEINARVMLAASKVPSKDSHLEAFGKTEDKYVLESTKEKVEFPKDVGFMVGHNMFDLVSAEIVARTAFEKEGFQLKLHPLTNQDYASKIANIIGWNHIVPPTFSGMQMLDNCDTAYTSTASEITLLAVAKGKKIVNISSFFNESIGIYYPIAKLLYNAENPQEVLNNIIDCKFSGLLFPWMDDIEERIQAYFDKTLELKETFGGITTPSNLKKIKE